MKYKLTIKKIEHKMINLKNTMLNKKKKSQTQNTAYYMILLL